MILKNAVIAVSLMLSVLLGSSAYAQTSQQEIAAKLIPTIYLLLDDEAPEVIDQPITECNDGIDNDGDGLVDWQFDVGCYNSEDGSETAGSRAQENGWTTFDLSADSRVIYVSSSGGNDANDGLTPETAVATVEYGANLVRDGFPDFLLLKRGDTWRNQFLGRFKSGRSNDERMVVYSYGNSTERPVLEQNGRFITDAAAVRNHLAIMGLEIFSYQQEPDNPEFTGVNQGGISFVGLGVDNNILLEDNYFKYSVIVMGTGENLEVRRNVIYRSYGVNNCEGEFRTQGMYMDNSNNSLIEENVWDGNGWNEDLPRSGPGSSCGTQFNHNVYLANVSNITIRNNLFLRASSQGLKVSGTRVSGVNGLMATDNLFAEGEIGMSMGGNGDLLYTHINSEVSNNVFTDIGRTLPTGRDLAWGLTIENNNNTNYQNNLFVNPRESDNSMAFYLYRQGNNNVTIENNLAHGFADSALKVYEQEAWNNVTIANNTLVSNIGTSPVVEHRNVGGVDTQGVIYLNNEYFTNANSNQWFSFDFTRMDITDWSAASGEIGATISSYSPSETRNVDSYASYLGVGSTLDDFAAEARKQSRFNWQPEYEAKTVNDYIREAYVQ